MLELTVFAGERERVSPLVVASVPASALSGTSALGAGPVGEEADGGACLLRPLDGPAGAPPLVAQYDPLAGSWPSPRAATLAGGGAAPLQPW